MMRRRTVVIAAILLLVGLLIAGYSVYAHGRPAPVSLKERLFDGVTYSRMVRWSPRPIIIHALTIDLKGNGVRLLVTPPDEKGSKYPLRARTTSQFLQEYGVQLAVNGDGFSPWWSRSLADYYPHVGDPVQPRGIAASRGKVYWTIQQAVPTLYMSSRNQLSFDAPAKPFNAISGETLLVMGGQMIPDLDGTTAQPRTAIGYSKNGRYLYLVVVDGRQPLYSEGMTVKELATLMISLGSQYAMNLDGGGSSTMVVQGPDGKARVVNSPIDNHIPGRERPVANHLGVFVGVKN
jgi:hypothetical protein